MYFRFDSNLPEFFLECPNENQYSLNNGLAPTRRQMMNQFTPHVSIARARRVSTLRSRQNGRHFTDDIFKCILLNENVRISIENSLKLVPNDQINNVPALVQIMAWRRPGDKSLSEPMVDRLLTHICVTRPQ